VLAGGERMVGHACSRDRLVIYRRTALILSTPALRAGVRADEGRRARPHPGVHGAAAARLRDNEARVPVSSIVGALMAARDEWVQSDGRAELPEPMDRALALLQCGLNIG